MASNVTYTDDKRVLNAITRQLRALAANPYVTVGVHGDEKPHEPEPGSKGKPIAMPQLAAIHEFGTDKIPERSFLRAGIDGAKSEIHGVMSTGLEGILKGQATGREILTLVGIVAESAVKAKIASGIAPALAESTKIARLRMTKAGRGVVNRGQRAARAHVMANGSGFAKFVRGAGGANKFRGGKWTNGKGNKNHEKALAKLQDAMSGKFTPLRNTGQLIQSITFKVGRGGGE